MNPNALRAVALSMLRESQYFETRAKTMENRAAVAPPTHRDALLEAAERDRKIAEILRQEGR